MTHDVNIFIPVFWIAIVFGSAVCILFVVFWMIVAWRAMRAHERIAESLDVLRKDIQSRWSRG